MFERLLVFILRLIHRYKRDKALVKYKDNPFALLNKRVELLDTRILKYSPSEGTSITLNIGVHNAVAYLELIDEISASMTLNESISDYAKGIHLNRLELTLDEFLTDGENRVVVFETFMTACRYGFEVLDKAYEKSKADASMIRYYQRVTQEITKDLTAVVEALEKLAYRT